MVTPKMIYLVNDWVYNSPIFGKVVKIAGYYPASQGAEGGVDHLKVMVEKGYSIMIFPEGTRSSDNSINRFHKGAFYIAEQLKLDVLPIYIHGNSETLPKGDHIIYDESITVVLGERIKFDDESFGDGYSDRTKKINQFFRKEFDKLRRQFENQDYFKNKLFLSYLYKENDVVETIKLDFRKNKNDYFTLNNLVGLNMKIGHIGDDMGQLDVLLTLQNPKRKLYSFVVSSQNRDIAKNNFYVNKRNINYVELIDDFSNSIEMLIISTEIKIGELDKLDFKNINSVILYDTNIKIEDLRKFEFLECKTEGRFTILKQKACG